MVRQLTESNSLRVQHTTSTQDMLLFGKYKLSYEKLGLKFTPYL